MKIEIQLNPQVNPKHFNYQVKNLYNAESVYHTDTLAVVIGDFTAQQEQEIIDLYNNTTDLDWSIDNEYMEIFLAEKYEANKIEGSAYISKISAKINLIAQAGTVTVLQAEEYGDNTSTVRADLSHGYWHSAYYKHIAYTPITELTDIHEEIRVYIRNYVNEKYPVDFQIT